MSYKGFFKPKNPTKYSGDPTSIIYRSSWELKLMMYLDNHPDVINWSSEELIIPYRSPVDNKVHRYYPDFLVKRKDRNNKIETILIEVKPFKQTQEPVKQNKINKRYINEVVTWGVNQAKWKAAQSYCSDRNWKFIIFTEKELGIITW